MTTIIMVHGVGGTADAYSRLAPAFRDLGWKVKTPTLRPDKRTAENPPADLHTLRLKDYVDDVEALAREVEAAEGVAPVLFGHSMGGLIVQKVAERGAGRAAVLLTPASPADVVSPASLAQAFTFANVLFSGKVEAKGHKIWKTGFSWGVLNRVPAAKHQGIFAGTVYDSGGVYADLAYPDRDPHRIAFIDETKISIPILTIGGGRDRATPIAGVRKVGEKYARVGGDYREYADNAHWIVDEPGTDQVIADIAAWLTAKGVTAARAAKAAPSAPAARPAPAKVKAAPVKATPAPGPAVAAAPARKAAKAAAKPKTTAPGAAVAAPRARAATTKPAPAKASAAKAPAKAKTPAKAAAAPKATVSKPKSK
jgi:alpha-beta hydrolase superfamily lysophospholipase